MDQLTRRKTIETLTDLHKGLVAFDLEMMAKASLKVHHTPDHKRLTPAIKRFQELLGRVDPELYTLLPDCLVLIDEANQLVTDANGEFRRIAGMHEADVNHEFDKLEQGINDLTSRAYRIFTQLYPFYLMTTVNVQALRNITNNETSVKQLVDRQLEPAVSSLDAIKIRKAEADELVNVIKHDTMEGGIIRRSQLFRKSISQHNWLSVVWLVLAFIFAGTILLVAIYFYRNINESYTEKVGLAIQYALSKLIILGILSFALVVCVKNYNAHSHNATVNRHRYNAILSYRSFVKPTTAPEVRDAILKAVSTCIFSPQDTGFTSSVGLDGNITKNIFEMTGKVSKGGGGD